jgi:phosphoglycerate dehydrogenase-like enzyme
MTFIILLNFSLFAPIPVDAAKKMTRLKIVAVISTGCESVVVKKRLQRDATFLSSRPAGIAAI